MTLIVALKYQDGVVLACDSRATFEGIPLMRNEERKFEVFGDNIAIVGAGAAGFEDKIVEELRSWFKLASSPDLTDFIEKCEDVMWSIYQKYKDRFSKDEEADFVTLVVASYDRIYRVFEKGFAEEEENYSCEGSGITYGEYILSQNFRCGMNEEEAKRLATFAVLQTAKLDPDVGGKVNLILIKRGAIQHVKDEEIGRIAEDIKTMETVPEKAIQATVAEIIEKRRWINTMFNDRFGFELFEQNEFAISGIQRRCQNENEFTNGVSALALLIDGVKVSELDKTTSEHQPGSVNALEAFLKIKLPSFDSRIIGNLREILTLRSKKMPIHEDDPKIVQVLLKWEFKIPPHWASLWIKALQKYLDSITLLQQLLQQK